MIPNPSYDSYFVMTKKEYLKDIPGVFKEDLWDAERDDQGNITGYTQITFADLDTPERNGRSGFRVGRKSNNWEDETVSDDEKLVVIQGQFSHLKGQASNILQKGQGQSYPRNSLLTAKEVRELFNNHELFQDRE